MGFSFEFRKISSRHQSNSKRTKEDKLKANNGVCPSSSEPNNRAQQVAGGKSLNRESLKGSTTRSDELVRHMSNLPGYLRCNDRGENVQGKALNVGVLDWARLEKWNHKQTLIPAFANNFTSLNINESSSRTAAKSSVNVACHKKFANQQGFLSSSIKASFKEGPPERVKQSFGNVKQPRHSGTEIKSIRDEQIFTPSEVKSSGRSHLEISFEKEKRKNLNKITLPVGNFASNVRHHGMSQVPIRNINGEADEGLEGLQDYNIKKKDKIRDSTSGIGLTSLKSKDKGVPFQSKEKMSVSNSETKKDAEQLRESDIDASHKLLHHGKPNNIVLLRPRESAQSSSLQVIQLSQLRMSFDENITEPSHRRLSDVSLLDEVYTEDLYSENPYSYALHSMVRPAPISEATQHKINTDQGTDHFSVVSETPDCSNKMKNLQSEDAYNEKDALDNKLRVQCVFNNSNESQHQETAEVAAQRGRNPSPNRRFSFSLGGIGRSVSFKERSTLPLFSSTYVSVKSGPVTSESSARLDNSSKEKPYSHSRTRSSPLRRLLDPILKHKASEVHHSAESSRTVKGTLDSISFKTTSVNESLHAEKSEGLSIQALLHLTIKNGLPLFKFVLDNGRKILAATVNLASPEKGDSGLCFTFYLVSEIKKKSGGWMSHGSKEKSCGYVYNVVGQMKSLSPKINEPSNQNSKKQHLVKEYILLGVEICQKDQVPPKFIQSQELAAVVVEIPCENFRQGVDSDNNNLQKKGCLKCLAEYRCTCSLGENDVFGRTTAILPGGIHGSPNKGEPTPLIYRWRSGGLCDCGGWDIGCRLLVLSNHKERSNISKSSKSHMGHLQLFVQEGAEQNRPYFTLVPLKDGFYSVEFSSSITHLQALFISVSLLSSQKPSALETNNTHEEIAKELSSKNNGELQGKAPVKYTPIPPLSPVGRV